MVICLTCSAKAATEEFEFPHWCDLWPGDSVIQCRPNMEVCFRICENWTTLSITLQIIMLTTEDSFKKFLRSN